MPGTIIYRYVKSTVPVPVADLKKVEQQLRQEVHDMLNPAPTASDYAMIASPVIWPLAVAAVPVVLTGAAAAAPEVGAVASEPIWGPAVAAAAALLWSGGEDQTGGGGGDASASTSEEGAD